MYIFIDSKSIKSIIFCRRAFKVRLLGIDVIGQGLDGDE